MQEFSQAPVLCHLTWDVVWRHGSERRMPVLIAMMMWSPQCEHPGKPPCWAHADTIATSCSCPHCTLKKEKKKQFRWSDVDWYLTITLSWHQGQVKCLEQKNNNKQKHYQKIMWHTCLHAFILPRTLTWRVQKWIYALNMPPSNTHSQSLTHTTHTHTYSDISHTQATPTIGNDVAGSLGRHLRWPFLQLLGVDDTIEEVHHLLGLHTGRVQVGVPAPQQWG